MYSVKCCPQKSCYLPINKPIRTTQPKTDPPIVELDIRPDKPIIEDKGMNVTLFCRVAEGNPSELTRVRWYLDGISLKELPECNDDVNDELCGVDPDTLLLENVDRQFLGNYSCEGYNAAGWGEVSVANDLVVYYEPGNATITHYPLVATKMKTVHMNCSVDDPGNPVATKYFWSRGGRALPRYDTPTIIIDPVGLDSRTNFSCHAYNEAGQSRSATIELDVYAPPNFIRNLHPRTGALFSSPNISLTCRVECVPACTITWLKDGAIIDKSDERYFTNETYLPAEVVLDFESIQSELHFNMSAWPGNKLDIYKDNSNYSCVSSSNVVGPEVKSVTDFHVECTFN